jgi:hypothetical protein
VTDAFAGLIVTIATSADTEIKVSEIKLRMNRFAMRFAVIACFLLR